MGDDREQTGCLNTSEAKKKTRNGKNIQPTSNIANGTFTVHQKQGISVLDVYILGCCCSTLSFSSYTQQEEQGLWTKVATLSAALAAWRV